MAAFFDQVPEAVQQHLRGIIRTSGLSATDESLEQLAQGWVEKMELFTAQTLDRDMEEVDVLPQDDARGALVLTYSGSLITLGPLDGQSRSAEYTSIGLRRDVPDKASKEDSRLEQDVTMDEPVVFTSGPIQRSSAVYKIAVPRGDLSPEEQSLLLGDATQILTEGFVEVNKTIILE
ncbi:hypothetical protein [Spirochaeta lutea]|uniref:Uncharacterized protein n=1 Tax=Spirochaeta lutea TaxID=1480694 RepID=A0A098QVY3_9SPIO|nr:hypothetical protein [Spirochaeta lutea]KGE72030.1 hypothetical protein DC28_07920 [Spirochaeta lutea]